MDCAGEILTVPCPNTGAMLGCQNHDARAWLFHRDNPKRRYTWTRELVETAPGNLVGVRTGRAAHKIDPEYAQALNEATDAGVIVSAIRCRVTVEGITPDCVLPLITV